MPQNAVGGGIQAGIRPEELDALRNSLASSVGKTYQSGSPRGESAGYTTSSPGWRQPAPPPPLFPPAPAMPMAHPAAGGGDRGPLTTGALGDSGPPRAATPEMIANATTTPSALFEPMNVATSPSSLGGFLPTPGPTQPLTPPMPIVHQTPTSLPGTPGWDAQTPTSLGDSLGPAPMIPPHGREQPTTQPVLGGPSSVPPPRVIHPDNPTTGKLRPGRDRATVPKRPKKGGQYSLRQQGDRRS